jgi:ABC-type sugar transport system ATPase subunit/ribose/xylose/arabinose/galactoside ABC-type transport system permease subunit
MPAEQSTRVERVVLARVAGVAKAFGATQALRDCSFELRAGEVHALVGENGSGKSTLVKILSGVHAPEAGTIVLDGTEAPPLRTPRMAQQNGIATVFQEVLVAEARSVLDNVWLGNDTLVRRVVHAREKRARAHDAFVELLGRPLPLSAAVERLSLSDRQACGIVRALLRRPRILILDEATSSLDVATRDRLFQIVQRMSRDGVGVVFITHRMDEISEIGDRITVMRSGETVATLERGAWTPRELVELMTGATRLTGSVPETIGRRSKERGVPVLSARSVQLAPGKRPFDVEIRTGELIGLAGLESHGQEQFLNALRGQNVVAGEIVRHDGPRDVVIRSTAQSAAEQIAFVPRERRQALFGWMSIRENFGMPTLARDARFGWLRPAQTRRRLAPYVDQMPIALRDPDDRITTLSGGNQQKVVLARWLAAEPRVFLLNDPTRGIDIGSKRDLYALLVQLAEQGVAVVMLSSELDEHIELMDRVLVFREQEFVQEIERVSLSRHALVGAFFGEQDVGAGEAAGFDASAASREAAGRKRLAPVRSGAVELLSRYSFGFALVLALVLLLVNLVRQPGSFGLTDQLATFAPIALAAMASAPSIISGGGGLDLTVSPLMYLTGAIFVEWLVPHGLGGAVAVPILLGVGAGVGAVCGLLIVGLRVQPVVATLSVFFVLLGLDLLIAPIPKGIESSWIQYLAGSIGPIPGALVTIGIPLLVWGLLGLIPYRRILYAVGSNDATAFASGVNVALVRVVAYAIGGLFAAIGGLALTALVSSVNTSLAATYTLLAIAAVALGGTSLWGGRGGLFGAILGAACIYLLQNLFTMVQVDPSWLQVMYGTMLLLAVVLSGIATQGQEPA